MAEAAVRAHGLRKSFGAVAAVRDLDLEVEAGIIAGLVGPDGAGKSTLLRLLIGLLRADGGRVAVAGYDVARELRRVKERIGYMPQHFSLYGDLTVAENMKFFADLYGVSEERFATRKQDLLRFSALGPFEGRLARHLSGGMQKKLALACNLFHTPKILLLDEPTTGVDPVSRVELWRLLADLNAGGTTILITTPYMDEAARCHRVGFIHQGRILAYDAPSALVGRMSDEIAELVAPIGPALKALRRIPGLKSVRLFGERIHAMYASGRPGLTLIRECLEAERIPVASLKTIPPNFEDVFIALAERGGISEDEGPR
jgi:ABC-2 type transport system ATP-binding protein